MFIRYQIKDMYKTAKPEEIVRQIFIHQFPKNTVTLRNVLMPKERYILALEIALIPKMSKTLRDISTERRTLKCLEEDDEIQVSALIAGGTKREEKTLNY